MILQRNFSHKIHLLWICLPYIHTCVLFITAGKLVRTSQSFWRQWILQYIFVHNNYMYINFRAMVLQCKKDKFFTSNKIALSSGSSLGSEQDASQSGILLVIAS